MRAAADTRFPFNDVVIIADIIGDDGKVPVEMRRDLEHTDVKTLRHLTEAVTGLGKKFHHYEHPKDLAKNAARHVNDVVLSIFGGTVSRNRMALVPSICETFGLSLVGPDTYGRVICQDKEVSKSLASAAGLKAAPHRIVRKESDIKIVSDFPVPYVAKPLLEGSSIGISGRSLVNDRTEGAELLRDMLNQFGQPVMVEKFIPGREASWCFIEGSEENRVRAFAEIVWDNDPHHFDHNLYDAPHKLISEGRKIVLNINAELSARDAAAMERLLQMTGDLGYGRIDGKLINGEFVFLEITPDAWIGPTGTFASSFINDGLAFDEVIARVLLSASSNPPGQSPND